MYLGTAPIPRRVAAAFAHPRTQHAFRILKDSEAEIEAEQIRLSLIPAPPFEEEERGRYISDALRVMGLEPERDSIGNVIVPYAGFGPNPVVIGAHLDTVFPRSVKLELQKKGRVLHMPGIADNGAGLAGMLWVLRAARAAGVRFKRPVLAVATVGEEGLGNLRGIRHLFSAPPWGEGTCDFIAVDVGGVQRVTHRGLGSRRFRVRMTGPGGHSWADFGRPNPVHAMASAVHSLVSFPRRGGTSFNVGMIAGGIGVNVIPHDAVIEVDLRSSSLEHLDALHAHLEKSVREAALSAGLEIQMESMGERPLGQTSIESELVQAAIESTRMVGLEPQLDVGSTDANLPMSLGVPAIALAAGGSAGNIHTVEEWFDPARRELGLQRLLGLIAVLAGIAE
jgi:acetylornithine deacetylase/succinyl-diaminopimelate desuccinylase-like protein